MAKRNKKQKPESQQKQRQKERQEEMHMAGAVVPKNDNQADYLKAIREEELVFATGPAGTGKTYLASATAIDLLREKEIRKIIITRPAVEAGEKLGALPGELEDKMAPWVVPFVDVMRERYGKQKFDLAVRNGVIEIVPFSFMRGRTFRNAMVILDEAQNTTPAQMEMFLTRIGDNSKAVINGDFLQSDISGPNGLKMAHDMMVKHDFLPGGLVRFEASDVVRSDLCAAWVKAFEIERKADDQL